MTAPRFDGPRFDGKVALITGAAGLSRRPDERENEG